MTVKEAQRSQSRFHTVSAIADQLGLSERTVRRWIARRELIAHRLGRQWRISEGDLELFLRERRGLNLLSKHGH